MPSEFEGLATQVMSRGPSMELAAVELVVLDGPNRGTRTAIAQGRARIGTGPGCLVRLSDPTVSRLHCEIVVGRDRVTVLDSGSTNGTFVDGVQVRDADVTGGATLR